MLTHTRVTPAYPERVVVIGAHGFVGRSIVRKLQSDNANVVGLGRGEVNLLAPDAANQLMAYLRPDDCVITVSAMAPCKNVSMLRDNVTIAEALATALSRVTPSHVINISSDAVYGDLPVPLTESVAPSPGSLHGVMHLAREILFANEIRCPIATVRPTLLYGPADPHNGYGPNQFRRKANAGVPITLFGDGEEQRDHVFIDDVGELISRIIQQKSVGILNLASGTVHTFRAIADLAVALSAKDVSITPLPRTGPMPHNGYRPFDISACRAAFPDFQYTMLEQGMRKAQQEDFGDR